MKIISLSSNIAGPACAISFCIKKYFYNNDYKTNIFDFLEISLTSIVKILEESFDNFKKKIKENYNLVANIDNKNSIYFNNFDKMISHHDLEKEYDLNDLENIFEKYNRRFHRLIEYIKSENILFFIRFGFEEKETIIDFINNVKKINSKCEVHFIHLNYDDKNTPLEYEKYIKNYYYINFYNYIDYNKQYSTDLFYKTQEFNWEMIKENILKKYL